METENVDEPEPAKEAANEIVAEPSPELPAPPDIREAMRKRVAAYRAAGNSRADHEEALMAFLKAGLYDTAFDLEEAAKQSRDEGDREQSHKLREHYQRTVHQIHRIRDHESRVAAAKRRADASEITLQLSALRDHLADAAG